MSNGDGDSKTNGTMESQSIDRASGKVDLSKYRSGALAEQLTNIISIPSAFRRVVLTMFCIGLAAPVLCSIFLPTDNLSGILVILAYVYAVFIGLVLGGCVGILRVFWTALRSVEAVLNILLEITGYAAADYERVQSGQAKMPTGGELMQQVYEEVISPAIAKAISGSFGWLGIPILWLYRRTLGFAVSLVIQAVSRRRSHNADDENENGSGEDADTSSSDISPEDERTETNCYSRRIEAFTKRAAGTVSSIGARIRFYAMMPLYIAFSVLLVIGLMPLLLIWWFGTGEPTAA